MDSVKDNRNLKSKKRQHEKTHIMKLEKQLNTQVNRLKQKAHALEDHIHEHEESSPDRQLEKTTKRTEKRIHDLEDKLDHVSKIRKNGGKVSKGKVTQRISDF